MASKNGFLSQPVEHSIRRLEQVELIAKIATGVAALTYVSGYLIETTYLGSFGMHADAIEFFRAKYLYIGFHFWFCVSVFIVLLILIKRFGSFIHSLRYHRQNDKSRVQTQRYFENNLELTDSEIEDARRILEHREPPGDWFSRPSFGEFRWSVIAFSIAFVFSLQIMFMNVETAHYILPLQFILLFSVGIHQLTHYYENIKYWGILYGRTRVSLFRLVGTIVEFALMVWIGFRVLLPNTNFLSLVARVYWIIGLLFIFIACLVPISLIKSYRQMAKYDMTQDESASLHGVALTYLRYKRAIFGGGKVVETQPSRWRLVLRLLWHILVLILSCIIIITLLVYALYLASPEMHTHNPTISALLYYMEYYRPVGFKIIGYLTMIMAFYVPLNIVLLYKIRTEMFNKLGVLPSYAYGKNIFSTLALRVVPITALYLVSVLTFSHIVYPKIPEEKAGGNFRASRVATIHLIKGASIGTCGTTPYRYTSVSPYYIDAGEASPSSDSFELEQGDHIILEEDANWLYLAKLEKKNCPEDWGKNLLQFDKPQDYSDESSKDPHQLNKPTHPLRPTVYAVNRSCIEFITYKPRITKGEVDRMPEDMKKDHQCPSFESYVP
jgi:hypothetical protein